MRFPAPLVKGAFVRRYKRFFVDVVLEDGREVVAHCPNTGSLHGCLVAGAPVLLEPADRPGRTLKWTWVAIELSGTWVGVDTGRAEKLVAESLRAGVLHELAGYERLIPQVPFGTEGRSRVDMVLSRGGRPNTGERKPPRGRAFHGDERVYVEVKNTTLVYEQGDDVTRGPTTRRAAFPDAVTARGRKHLLDLRDVVDAGHRAAIVFSVQRDDCRDFIPADAIDPAWSETLREVVAGGVEAYALCGRFTPQGVSLDRRLEIAL